ncbi:MAG TPA: hypothetical protein DCZ76_04715 [Treponema sp.]|nr:hypothetical protein [Treponema sp.]
MALHSIDFFYLCIIIIFIEDFNFQRLFMRITPPRHTCSTIIFFNIIVSILFSLSILSCSAKDDSGTLVISMPDSSAARSLSSTGSLGEDFSGGDPKVYTVAVRDRDNKDVEVFKNVKPGSVLTITELMPGTYNVAIRMIMAGSDDVIYYGATEAVVKGGTENAAHIKMDSAINCCNCRIKFDLPGPDIQDFTAIITCENGDHYYISGGFPEDDDEGGSHYDTNSYFFEPGFSYTLLLSISLDDDWSGPFKRSAKATKNGIVFD